MDETYWSFPGTDDPPPVYDLPPPRFAAGDRVTSPHGRGTVLLALPHPCVGGHRAYHVRRDWSSAPPGFGQMFGENELELLAEQPEFPDQPETELEPPQASPALALPPTQAELF